MVSALRLRVSMGASGKWIRALVGLPGGAGAGKGRKWSRLWRSSSSQRGSSAAPSEAPSEADAPISSSLVAAVVRAPPRDFRVIRQEWAAVRIQAAFRAFLVLGYNPPPLPSRESWCPKLKNAAFFLSHSLFLGGAGAEGVEGATGDRAAAGARARPPRAQAARRHAQVHERPRPGAGARPGPTRQDLRRRTRLAGRPRRANGPRRSSQGSRGINCKRPSQLASGVFHVCFMQTVCECSSLCSCCARLAGLSTLLSTTPALCDIFLCCCANAHIYILLMMHQ